MRSRRASYGNARPLNCGVRRQMKRSIISAVFFTACLSCGSLSAAVSHLPAEVRASLARTSEFWRFVGVAAIPDEVRVAFAAETGEPFAMAEPGAEWQSADVPEDEALPRRRLELVATSKTHCFLFYELGGRTRTRHVAVFTLNDDGAELVWRALRDGSVRHPAHILLRIDSGALDDDPKHEF
jgi:hypothetical protein